MLLSPKFRLLNENTKMNTNAGDEEAVQELRTVILERSWKNSAQFMVEEIEFITDLCAAQQLSVNERAHFLTPSNDNYLEKSATSERRDS